jgi:hypothetical protein
MWLLRRLASDFTPIADFRRDDAAAIVGTYRAFVLFCLDQSLFPARLVALDGSKFWAAASAKRVMGRREIAEEATRLDRRIAEYLVRQDENNAREPDEAPSATAASLQALKARRAELNRLAASLDDEECSTLVEGEPDNPSMGTAESKVVGRELVVAGSHTQTMLDLVEEPLQRDIRPAASGQGL